METTLIERVAEQIQAAREYLAEEGWEQISEVGDLGSPGGHFVWFSSGYSYGEFTLTASIREHGAGPALDQIRFRLTEVLASKHENLALELVRELNAEAKILTRNGRDPVRWPPMGWVD